MTRKLLVFFAACVAVSIASLSIAYWIGLPDDDKIEKALVTHGNWHWSTDDEGDKSPDTSQRSTKSYVWNGSDALVFHIPVSVRYTKSDTSALLIEAPENLHKILSVKNGQVNITGNYHSRWSDNNAVITISGPRLPEITINSVADVELDNVNQDRLSIEVHGAGSVRASGRVQKLDVDISGAGSGDFEYLQAEDIMAQVNGAGSLDLRGSRNVDVKIHGAGSATLHQKPANLTSGIFGVGAIDEDY